MELKKENLYNEVEKIIGNGVAEMEHIDTTSQKIVNLVWPIIEYLYQQNDSNSASKCEYLVRYCQLDEDCKCKNK